MRCPGGQTTQTGSFQCTVSSTLYPSQMTKLLSHPSEEGHFSRLYPQSVFQDDSRFTRTSTFKFSSHFITDLYRVHMTGNARPLYLLTSRSKVPPNGTRLKYKTGENIFPPTLKQRWVLGQKQTNAKYVNKICKWIKINNCHSVELQLSICCTMKTLFWLKSKSQVLWKPFIGDSL